MSVPGQVTFSLKPCLGCFLFPMAGTTGPPPSAFCGLGAVLCLTSLQKQPKYAARLLSRLLISSARGGGLESQAGEQGGMGQRHDKSWEHGQGFARGHCALHRATGSPVQHTPGSQFGHASGEELSVPPCFSCAGLTLSIHMIGLGLKPTTFMSARKIKLWLFYGTYERAKSFPESSSFILKRASNHLGAE